MKWETEWWGIVFTAESDNDRKALEQFFALLPKEPESHYEEGNAELVEGEKGCLQLVFSR